MTRWSIKNLESLQSQESGELVSISRSETNLLKLSIVLRIGLLYLYQIIGDSVLSKYEGIVDITLLSRTMLGKSMNSIPLLMNEILMKCLMWLISESM